MRAPHEHKDDKGGGLPQSVEPTANPYHSYLHPVSRSCLRHAFQALFPCHPIAAPAQKHWSAYSDSAEAEHHPVTIAPGRIRAQLWMFLQMRNETLVER